MNLWDLRELGPIARLHYVMWIFVNSDLINIQWNERSLETFFAIHNLPLEIKIHGYWGMEPGGYYIIVGKTRITTRVACT
jgi:hypothetical protein